MSIVRQGTLPVGSLDHAITLNVQSSGGSHFETVTDTTPYLHRASPQDVASSMNLKKVVGGTIAWNQLMNGYSYTANSGALTSLIPSGVQIVAGHKLLMMAQTSGYATTNTWIYLFTRANNTNSLVGLNIKTDRTLQGQIVVPSVGGAGGHANSNGDAWIYQSNADVDISDLMIIDLTQMFGSSIADYIYSLEQAHAGDGVAWFRKLFPKAYYPYNAGELLSVKTSARKTYDADNVEIGSYPLDDNLELRGIPKLDGNNELYYDGDTYASDGTVTRRYGVIDLGTLNWSYSGSFFNISLAGIVPPSWVRDGNEWGICQKYIIESWSSIDLGTFTDKSLYGLVYNGYLILRVYDSSYTDASTFISAMNGVYLVYEKTTPTTESADAYTQSQRVGATEEFVDGRTVEIPVGNVSEYKRLIQGDTP